MKDVILTMICPFCGNEHEVDVNEQDFVNYLAGDLAQEAFPYLNATQREQIITHICPQCQEEVFAEF